MAFNKDIRICIADDHPVVRNGIINMLNKEADMQLVGETGDGNEILNIISKSTPDILILDLNMPGLDPVTLTQHIVSGNKATKVLILSAYDDDAYIHGILSAGAHGYLIKDEALESLLTAIRAVARGESWISQRIAGRLLRKSIENPKRVAVEPLTEREYDILRLIAMGLNNEEISAKLFLAKRTVQNYVSNIYSKLELTSRTEAVLYAIRQNIVNISEVRDI